MSDLIEFVRRMLDEDEAVARAASPGPWKYYGIESVSGSMFYDATRVIGSVRWEQPGEHDGTIIRPLLEAEADSNGAHIARHDPARVLAEVAAKRAIVDRATEELSANQNRMEGYEIHQNDGARGVAGDVLRHLAAPYAGCEGYRSEWAP